MEFKIGDKVQATDTIRRQWELQMRKGQTGIIKSFKDVYGYYGGRSGDVSCAVVELKSETVTVPVEELKPYEKQVRKTIESLDNEELLSKYQSLVLDEQHATSIKTKSYEKILKDTNRVEVEILKRMNR